LLLSLAGCRHYAGWVDREVRMTPLSEETQETEGFDLALLQPPKAADGLIQVKAVRVSTSRQRVRKQLVARRTYTEYHWSTPILKPLCAVTIVIPIYLTYIEPHNHSGGTWGRGDFCRDWLSYYNFFEAFACGRQKPEKEWTVLWTDETWEPRSRAETPLPGAEIEFWFGAKRLGSAVAGADGVASFDLRPHVTAAAAELDQQFDARLVQDGARKAGLPIPVKQDVLKGLAPKP